MNNQFITTTELREQSSKVVSSLLSGENFTLIYRSKIIGVIKPAVFKAKVIDNIGEFKRTLSSLKPKKLIPYSKREKIYREYLKKRHG